MSASPEVRRTGRSDLRAALPRPELRHPRQSQRLDRRVGRRAPKMLTAVLPSPPRGKNASAVVGDPRFPVREPVRRRSFTPEYKLDVLAEYDAAPAGSKVAVLRRRSLCSSHIVEWRRARDAGALAGLSLPRGRPRVDSRGRENTVLRRRVELLERELTNAKLVIDAQGKCLSACTTCPTSATLTAGPSGRIRNGAEVVELALPPRPTATGQLSRQSPVLVGARASLQGGSAAAMRKKCTRPSPEAPSAGAHL